VGYMYADMLEESLFREAAAVLNLSCIMETRSSRQQLCGIEEERWKG